MVSLAEWAEGLREGLGKAFRGNIFGNTFLEDDFQFILDGVKKAGDELIIDPIQAFPGDVKEAWNFLLNPGEGVKDTVSTFGSHLIEGWTKMLTAAMEQLNVDARLGPVGPITDIVGTIQEELRYGDEEATKRVTVALGIVNLVVVTGSAASIAAELASAGTVRTLSESIQSWIWANGLGGMTSMAYTPQLNASIGPWLGRKYHERAQAMIPTPSELTRMQLREVFLPGRREELVGTEERPVFDSYMAQQGFSKFWSDSVWGAHWQLPSISQLNEMLFRGVIDQEEWTRLVTFNDYEPTQIPRLQEIIYNPYTRVDVRRMHRLGVLNDDELLQAYADLGNFAPMALDEDDKLRAQFVPNPDFTIHKAQALVIFTKIFNIMPELRQRFAKGHIDPDELLQAIRNTGIPEDRAKRLWETIVPSETKARTAPERELTRAMIASAWKKRLISFGQGIFLLQRIGWSQPEAELILRVRSEAEEPADLEGTGLGARLTGSAVGMVPIDIFEPEG